MGWVFVSSAKEGQGLSPSLTPALGLGWSRQDLQNQRNVWFSVFPSKGTREGSACDAVLEDLLHQELV